MFMPLTLHNMMNHGCISDESILLETAVIDFTKTDTETNRDSLKFPCLLKKYPKVRVLQWSFYYFITSCPELRKSQETGTETIS